MMKRKILTWVLACMFSLPMQGQFLKKLQEKVGHQFQSEAKSMVSLGSKGAVSLDILMDQNLDVFEFQRALEMADPMEISELYDFEWKYTFDIKTKNGEGRMHVLFKKDAAYFALQISESTNDYLVVDPERNMNVLFSGVGNQKIISASRNKDPDLKEMVKKKNTTGYSFNKIGEKIISGYQSEGFQAENTEFVYTFYIAKETAIGIHDFHLNSQKLIPPNFNPNWLKKGILMQMICEGKKSVRNNITITCIGIDKQRLQLRSNSNMGLVKN